MHDENSQLEFEIVNTVDRVPEQDWQRLFGNDLIEGYGYHKALENSNLKEFSMFYLLIKRNNYLIAVIPFFTMDFSITTLIRGGLQKIIFAIRKLFKRFLMIRILFVGTPMAEQLHIGISKNENKQDKLKKAFDELFLFARSERIKTIAVYNLTAKDIELGQYLHNNGFSVMENVPTTRITLKEKSFEEYISRLGSNTRKDLRRKLRKSAQLTTLTTEITDNINEKIDDIYKLYMNNFGNSDLRFEVLTPEFLTNICKYMAGVAKYFITKEKNGKIVAFNLCFIKNNTCIDKVIGLDYNCAFKYHLYYTTFCHNISWCLENDIYYYQPGQGDYDAKIRMGATLIPLFIYIKSLNPLLNFLMKPILTAITPKKFDPALSNLEKYKNLRVSETKI